MSAFPDDMLVAIAARITTVSGVEAVKMRPLDETDENGACSLFVAEVVPGAVEMNGQITMEPTFQTYMCLCQHMVKNADREAGVLIHRAVAKDIKRLLYRDTALQVALRPMSETLELTERFMDLKVGPQRYGAGELSGTFTFLSVTDFYVTTETI